jgi:hypothetical protein
MKMEMNMRWLYSVMVVLLLSVPASGQTLLGTNVRVDPDGIVDRPLGFWTNNVIATGGTTVTTNEDGRLVIHTTPDADMPVPDDVQAALDLKQDADTAATDAELAAHAALVDNPHTVTKAQVGLGSVDNTTDAAKPVSTATQTALDAKQDAATAATDAELADGLALKQDADTAATDAELATRALKDLSNVTLPLPPAVVVALKGDTGDQGIQGIQGIVGADGPAGADGHEFAIGSDPGNYMSQDTIGDIFYSTAGDVYRITGANSFELIGAWKGTIGAAGADGEDYDPAALDLKQDAATAATDAELTAGLALKQDADTAATLADNNTFTGDNAFSEQVSVGADGIITPLVDIGGGFSSFMQWYSDGMYSQNRDMTFEIEDLASVGAVFDFAGAPMRGNGSLLSSLNASQLSSGTVNNDRLDWHLKQLASPGIRRLWVSDDAGDYIEVPVDATDGYVFTANGVDTSPSFQAPAISTEADPIASANLNSHTLLTGAADAHGLSNTVALAAGALPADGSDPMTGDLAIEGGAGFSRVTVGDALFGSAGLVRIATAISTSFHDIADRLGTLVIDSFTGVVSFDGGSLTEIDTITATGVMSAADPVADSNLVTKGYAEVNYAKPNHAYINIGGLIVYDEEGDNLHLQVDYSTAPDFSNAVSAVTTNSRANWLYFNGTSYHSFPSEGITMNQQDIMLGAVLYQIPADIASTGIYVRVRAYDGIDWGDYVTAFGYGSVTVRN